MLNLKMNRKMEIHRRPELSIVTICKDDADGLRRTLQSTRDIDRRFMEQVVVDGNSQDNTLELLQDPTMRVTRWISESDSGIAEAFNKGVALSTGKYVLFLNAGDTLISGAIATLSDVARNQCPDLIIGEVVHIDGHGRCIRRLSCRRPWAWQKVRNYWPHQGMLIRRDIFSAVGVYDLEFSRAGMDYEWSLRYLRMRGGQGITVSKVAVAMMPIGGVSMTNFRATFSAYHRARLRNQALPRVLSWCFTQLFVGKRSLGNTVRQLSSRRAR